MIDINRPITDLRMVGPAYATRLKKIGILTIRDLLYHVPARYENFSVLTKINLIQEGEIITVNVTVDSFQNVYTKSGKKIQKAMVSDETGSIEVIWYNQTYLNRIIKNGVKLSLSGKVASFGSKLILNSPQFEIPKPITHNSQLITNIHTGRLVPIYPETEGISSKWLRSRIYSVLTKFSPQIDELLPFNFLTKYKFLTDHEAIFKVHFPKDLKEANSARKRLEFDELLTLQIKANIQKRERQKNRVKKILKVKKFIPQIVEFTRKLPFQLTRSQKIASKEILSDLSKTLPMNRLLEGDVGSGKTVVSAIAVYLVFLNKRKSLLMAPTEILAQQHFTTVKNLLNPYGIKVGLVTGDIKSDPKEYDVLIGTHALIAKKIKFSKIGLVVIDEQQRFGVEQRGILRKKTGNPHLLSMTATPIPRTIALTLYADLDLSILTQMPIGRIPVRTWVVPTIKRNAAYEWIKIQIKKNNPRNQVFIICPFIEESESLKTVKAAKAEYELLSSSIFPDFKLGLLHGRLKYQEKDKILKEFKEGKIDILVSTPVIEVGIDIPNAIVMVIEAADRFGLAQLHQLRGRVGRSDKESYCLLFTEIDNKEVISRLKNLETTRSGPELAELDLKLRGAGELFGKRQHGLTNDLKIARLDNLDMIAKTKTAAYDILVSDPSLSAYPYLHKALERFKIDSSSND